MRAVTRKLEGSSTYDHETLDAVGTAAYLHAVAAEISLIDP